MINMVSNYSQRFSKVFVVDNVNDVINIAVEGTLPLKLVEENENRLIGQNTLKIVGCSKASCLFAW